MADRSEPPAPGAPQSGRTRPPRSAPVTTAERAGWTVLALLLLGLAIAAGTADRTRWSSFLGDETTYLMAAESLGWDLDLRYQRADYERFVAHWGRSPEGLILQSGDGGRTLVYGKPFFYSAFLAPFVRWSPVRGPFVANAVLLAVAAWLAARTLRRRLGGAAPWWMVAFLFASVTFTYVFWAHADLFLASLTALAFALVFSEGRGLGRWAAAGALLVVVVFSRPVYAPLLLAALVGVPRARRLPAAAALVAGAALVTAGAAAVHQATAGQWTAYGGQRAGFYESTGFPTVDFPPEEWRAALERSGNMAWGGWVVGEGGGRETGTLARVNSLYLLAGRNVGLLPYFLPLLLPFLAGPRGAARWALLGAVALAVGALLLLRPFNFYGGGAAIANRYFLPLYPALWFVAARPRGAFWAGLAGLAAIPFLWPLWLQGSADPRTEDQTWRYPSPAAVRWLPHETTQSHLKPSGQDDVVHHGLWLKPLGPAVRVVDRGRLALLPGTTGEILVGSARPLAALGLRVRSPRAAVPVLLAGGRASATGEPGYWRVGLESETAAHPMWWTPDLFYLYRLRLRFEDAGEAVLFSLHPVFARGP